MGLSRPTQVERGCGLRTIIQCHFYVRLRASALGHATAVRPEAAVRVGDPVDAGGRHRGVAASWSPVA